MPRENGSSIWFDGSFSFLIPLQHEWIVWLVGTASEKQIAKATQGLRAYCGKNLGGHWTSGESEMTIGALFERPMLRCKPLVRRVKARGNARSECRKRRRTRADGW